MGNFVNALLSEPTRIITNKDTILYNYWSQEIQQMHWHTVTWQSSLWGFSTVMLIKFDFVKWILFKFMYSFCWHQRLLGPSNQDNCCLLLSESDQVIAHHTHNLSHILVVFHECDVLTRSYWHLLDLSWPGTQNIG